MLPFDHVQYEFLQMDKTAQELNPSFYQRGRFGTCPSQLLLQRRCCRNIVAENNKDDGFSTDGGHCDCHDTDATIIISIIIITMGYNSCEDDGGGWWLFC